MSGCCREDLDSSSFRAASLEVVRERVDNAQDAKRRAQTQRDLAFKIRTFFQLD